MRQGILLQIIQNIFAQMENYKAMFKFSWQVKKTDFYEYQYNARRFKIFCSP